MKAPEDKPFKNFEEFYAKVHPRELDIKVVKFDKRIFKDSVRPSSHCSRSS